MSQAMHTPPELKHDADWSAVLETRSGLSVHVRPAQPSDAERLSAFFEKIAPEAMRFRFLTACRVVNDDQLHAMTRLDHMRTENFLAFDPDDPQAIVATAMLAGDAHMQTAEVAIAIADAFRGRGIGWVLLEHVARFARARGYRTLQSIESRDNHAAIELEREMGFMVRAIPGDATVVLVEAQLQPGAGA